MIPNVFKEYITEPKETFEVKGLKLNRREKNYLYPMISKKKVLKDLEAFYYLYETCYCGCDYFKNAGFNIHNAINHIMERIATRRIVTKRELGRMIYYELKDQIKDNHFFVTIPSGTKKETYYCGGHKAVYFADVLVEKLESSYRVIKSLDSTLKIGTELCIPTQYLYATLAPAGKEFFLIGVADYKKVSEVIIYRGDIPIQLNLHICRAGEASRKNNVSFEIKKERGVTVITSGSFSFRDNNSCETAQKLGEELSNESILLWNLIGNSGGSSLYAQSFIEGLNTYANNHQHMAWLKTPYTDFHDQREMKEWYMEWYYEICPEYSYETATYDGTIIALMNRYTGSSAEMAVGYSKSIRKHLLIGENSHGAGIFGEQMQYVLPYSGIQLGMGCKLFLGDFSEGEGYQPDYWVDSSDVKGEVICWYKNQATYSPGWFSEP